MDKPTPDRPAETAAAGETLYGSDLIAEALREQDFPYICLNPGASYRGLHDSLVNHLGNETPEIITCMHEEHAVGIAQGYAKITDTALAVAVHSNVGLMHASMGIFNAWCDRTPMLVIGATGPIDAAKRRPWIEWIHTTVDQADIVRGYTKWDDQPGSPEAAVESIRRGVMLTNTRPSGPVYVNLDVSIQEAELAERPDLGDVSHYPTPDDAEPPKAALQAALDILKGAERPFIFCGRGSRSEAEWTDRIRLAEAIGARTTAHMKLPAGFPTTHPAFVGETGWRLKGPVLDAIRNADAIVMLDWLDAGNTIKLAFPPGTERPPIIHISNDFHIHRGWNMDYGGLPAADVTIPTVSATAVRALLDGLEAGPAREALTGWDVPEVTGSGEIGLMDLARAFHHASKGREIAITGRPLGWPVNANEIDHPLGFLGHTGGGGLGAGTSIAVGAALGLREIGSERRAVAILGDGDYTMGLTAIWNAATLRLPVLFLIANNHSYYNDEDHQIKVARRRGRPEENAPIGQRMQGPEPDLAGLARGLGLEAPEPVTDLADLPAALAAALDRVAEGAAVVLDVRVRQEYIGQPMVELS
ncbi:benzoylformate decarboxylase [Oceanicola granulosus HTCC2516]|uniref:Benzoylformate decarboxylase n=1 Tax=Oceanicola granulosus (strain ATCC BAA-861 / DSM 15982 / KCTC 12143 / HTCC2516) TaxID=314256 RepID=Q2CGP7_OCEGH|nr:thiamine pyrophosphate-binding protein [Oceanicola granulosus]EAR51888.1 benzoylformate decarboxylase [Oceanicola granulosus HTCC2516]